MGRQTYDKYAKIRRTDARVDILGLKEKLLEHKIVNFKIAESINWLVVVYDRRTLQPLEIPLLIKIHRKRGMGWLIAIDEPVFNKPAKPKEPVNSEPYYDYVI